MSDPETSGGDVAGPRAVGGDPAPAGRWLSIVGLGEDGIVGLGERAREAIRSAEVVFGGRRHLRLVADLVGARGRPWPVPFDTAMTAVVALRGRRVAVLASGDPFVYGVGTTLTRLIPPEDCLVLPAPSSFALAAARLGWALPEIDCVSLHGRPLEALRRHLHDGARILALTSDGAGPAAIAALLVEAGFGASDLTIFEALGGPRERRRHHLAAGAVPALVDPLNVVAIEAVAGPAARPAPLGFGFPDEVFEHDGQITKREIRAVTLSSLAPQPGRLLWDIGAGSGSIALEWLAAHESLAAVAIEADPQRAARIRRNAAVLGLPRLRVVEGRAPAALDDLPAPDAIFVGGGGSAPGVMEAAIAALKPGGRLVANAVTLEMETVVAALHARLGGTLSRLEVARAGAVGRLTAWRPALPVVQFVWVKPW